MKFLKLLGLLILAGILILIFVMRYSATETRLRCDGEMTTQEMSVRTSIFMKLEEYRWWVNLWSESDGSLWVEVPNVTVEYFGRVIDAGEQLQIYNDGVPRGHFSKLSKALSLTTHVGSFEGFCKRASE